MSGALLMLMLPAMRREADKARRKTMDQAMDQVFLQAFIQGFIPGFFQGISQAIRGAVSILRDMGVDDQEIKSRIMEQYHLPEEDVEEYMQSV